MALFSTPLSSLFGFPYLYQGRRPAFGRGQFNYNKDKNKLGIPAVDIASSEIPSLAEGGLLENTPWAQVTPEAADAMRGGGISGMESVDTTQNPWGGMTPEAMAATRPQQGGLFGGLKGAISNNWMPLLQAGLGMMEAGGWQKMPVTLGQAMGRGGIPAIGTKIHLDEQARQDEYRQEQLAQMRIAREAYAKQAEAQAQQQASAAKRAEEIAMLNEQLKTAINSGDMETAKRIGMQMAFGSDADSAFKTLVESEKTKTGEFDEIARAGGLAPGTPEYEKARKDYVAKKTQFAPPHTVLNVNTQSTASNEAQKQFMQESRQSYNALRSAPALLENIQKAKALVPRAGSFVGSGGDVKKNVVKFFNNNFGAGISEDAIASAEELKTRLFQSIMENLKKMDAQPSQLQQMIMMDSLGQVTNDPNAIPRILDVMDEIVRQKVDTHNRDVNSAIERGILFPYDPRIQLPELKKNDIKGKYGLE